MGFFGSGRMVAADTHVDELGWITLFADQIKYKTAGSVLLGSGRLLFIPVKNFFAFHEGNIRF